MKIGSLVECIEAAGGRVQTFTGYVRVMPDILPGTIWVVSSLIDRVEMSISGKRFITHNFLLQFEEIGDVRHPELNDLRCGYRASFFREIQEPININLLENEKVISLAKR